jgi:phenylacetate-coenzyme A ligase PaaK-like adenylate-forming protein
VELPPFDPWYSALAAGEVVLATYATPQTLDDRREHRLTALLECAARRSPLYRRLLHGRDLASVRLHDLPVMHKADLMHRFDEWVTDPRLRLDDVRRFTADPSRIADPYLGRYVVRGRPVPPDQLGATALLTNLANHVQPLIRYDLADRIVMHSRPCACGCQMPVIDVQGRSDDTLSFRSRSGQSVRVLPLALSTVLEDDAGLFDFQLEQTGPCALQLRTAMEGDPADDALRRARTVLAAFLARQGLADVDIHTRSGQPSRRGPGGKILRVMALQG